jgi:hypothetical protein
VRIDTNDYSVDPRAIGSRVDVAADLDVVRVRHGGRLVAEHPRRWARGMTITDPAHVSAGAALRHAYQHPITRPEGQSLVRDLADYDRAFGIDAHQMTTQQTTTQQTTTQQTTTQQTTTQPIGPR